MGKKIDRFVLSLLLAGGFYLYFYRALGNRWAALALALCCFALASRLLRGAGALIGRMPWLRRRRIRRNASGALMRLACMPRDEALRAMEALLHRAYAGEYAVELAQLPPSAALRQEQLFEIWRAHSGEARLAVCASGRASEEARALAANLRAPLVAIVDAPLIAQLYAEQPDAMPACETAARPKRALRHVRALLLRRKNAPRSLLLSASLLLLYILSANIFYLIFSMLLLFLALASLKAPSRPAALFAGGA